MIRQTGGVKGNRSSIQISNLGLVLTSLRPKIENFADDLDQ